MTTSDVMLTPAQAVRKYPYLTRSTVYSACQDGLLPHYRVPSRRGKRGKYLIKETDLLAWIESNRHEAGAVATVPLKLKHL